MLQIQNIGGVCPQRITKSYLTPLKCSVFNIKKSCFSKATLAC